MTVISPTIRKHPDHTKNWIDIITIGRATKSAIETKKDEQEQNKLREQDAGPWRSSPGNIENRI
jgi:hypothetical protein